MKSVKYSSIEPYCDGYQASTLYAISECPGWDCPSAWILKTSDTDCNSKQTSSKFEKKSFLNPLGKNQMFGLRLSQKKRRSGRSQFERALGCERLESRVVLASYHLTFNDEFNAFNSTRWKTSDFWGMRNNPGDYQGQWFSDTANNGYNPFIFNNGVMSIQANPTPSGVGGGQPYVSGQLTTAHLFTQMYGYVEVRAKAPTGSGLWSRFWLLTDDGNWPGEYDVFEILGKEQRKVHQTTHFKNSAGNNANQGATYTGIDPTDGFHTYGFLWEPTGVTWFVDGVATQTQINRIDKPMYFLIDLAVGKDPSNLWPGNPNASNRWPASLELDYFRVYSADPSLPSVTPDAGYTPSTLPNGHTLEVTSTTPQLPAGWAAGDLGTPNVKGSATWNDTTGQWMLKGAGFGISGFGDQGHFAGKALSGDGVIEATVQSVTAINSNDVKAGVMIRESTASNARGIALFYTTSHNSPNVVTGITLQSRSATGGTTTTLATVPGTTANYWAIPGIPSPPTLRIVRTGNIFTASYSTDAGVTWTTVGTPQTITMANTVQAGLAISGNQNNYLRLSRAVFKMPLLKVTPTSSFSSVEGSTVTYGLVLNTRPSANVQVTLTGNSAQATLSPSTFTFTPSNWNIPQTVNVLLKEDYLVEGVQSLVIGHSVASTDLTYHQVNSPTVTITFADGTDPSIVSSSTMILENSPVGSTVGSLSAVNAFPTQNYQFSLVPGGGSTDNNSFTIVGNELRTTQSFDFETKSSYAIRVRATDSLGESFERLISVQVGDVLEVIGSPVLAAGAIQRSLVRSISFSFDKAITYQQGAFEVVRRGGAGGTVDIIVDRSTGVLGQTIIMLTFSGVFTRNQGALVDGNYELRIHGDKITGWLGANYTFGTQEADKFFAYYGDTNGDRFVSPAELNQFRSLYRRGSNQRSNANFDYDGAVGANGQLDMVDFAQIRARFGRRLGFV